jgi:hypothetical protein
LLPIQGKFVVGNLATNRHTLQLWDGGTQAIQFNHIHDPCREILSLSGGLQTVARNILNNQIDVPNHGYVTNSCDQQYLRPCGVVYANLVQSLAAINSGHGRLVWIAAGGSVKWRSRGNWLAQNLVIFTVLT